MRIKVYTLGCKVNQFESQAISEALTKKGHHVITEGHDFHILLVNTCAVTKKACYQARQAIRKALRKNPGARVIVTGCYAQIDPWGIMESIDNTSICIVGNDQKEMLLAPDLKDMDCMDIFVGDIFKTRQISNFHLERPVGRTRAYLRIQDGCDAFCAYCVVPYARGRSRSLEAKKVIEQARQYVDAGVKEIIVTGIHVGFYGKDLEANPDLTGLLDQLTRSFPDCRFRLSSIEPNELTEELIGLFLRRDNLCKHLHIPLQSGSDRILKAMGRRYSVAQFIDTVNKVKKALPETFIGTDLLVGFPGETEEDFQKTLKVVETAPIDYVHAFPFSKRPGTRASGMKETSTKKEKARRTRLIISVGQKKRDQFQRSFIGKRVECLVERVDKRQGTALVRAGNYLLVEIPAQEVLSNDMVLVEIQGVDKDHLIGKCIF